MNIIEKHGILWRGFGMDIANINSDLIFIVTFSEFAILLSIIKKASAIYDKKYSIGVCYVYK
jgi:hypothetical protein